MLLSGDVIPGWFSGPAVMFVTTIGTAVMALFAFLDPLFKFLVCGVCEYVCACVRVCVFVCVQHVAYFMSAQLDLLVIAMDNIERDFFNLSCSNRVLACKWERKCQKSVVEKREIRQSALA